MDLLLSYGCMTHYLYKDIDYISFKSFDDNITSKAVAVCYRTSALNGLFAMLLKEWEKCNSSALVCQSCFAVVTDCLIALENC